MQNEYTLIPHRAMPKNPHTEDAVPKISLESITPGFTKR